MRALFFCILLAFSLSFLPGDAFAAPAKPAGQSAKPAPKPSAKASPKPVEKPASKSAALEKLVADFDALAKDEARASRRDNWINLQEKFKKLEGTLKGGEAALASFYQARSREELGKRSYSAGDHKQAADLFAVSAKRYPSHSSAPQSLLRRAVLLSSKLGKPNDAAAALQQLRKKYPKSPEAADAARLLAEIAPADAAAPEKGGSTAVAPRRSGSSSASPPGTLMEQLGLDIRTIMLDAGHGGKDPGAMAGGIVEREFTLAMTKRVGALLQKKGFNVIYTRTSDVYVTLQERPEMANSRKADLFISIHANANKDEEIRGLEIYYLDMAKTTDAAKVAARENAVSVKNISDLQFILTDLMLSAKLEESRDLADCVRKSMLASLRKGKQPAVDHGVRSAPFYVLMGARMPAVLVECGYITNKQDAAAMKSEKFLQAQAQGLVNGILAYREKLAKFK